MILRSLSLALCVLWLSGCAAKQQPTPTPADPAQTAAVAAYMQSPLFAGTASSPDTIILFTNPQCPACRAEWPIMRALVESRPEGGIKLVIVGQGFDHDGTAALYAAALIAEQNQALGRQYLSEVMEYWGTRPTEDFALWNKNWQTRSGSAVDMQRFRAGTSTDAAKAFNEATLKVAVDYKVEYTPTVVINGRVYTGERSVPAYAAFMKKSRPSDR